MQNSFAVNRAFSAQSSHFDVDEDANPVIADLRDQVHQHVGRYMRDSSHILELNSGTGIDAFRFVSKGHSVHATDIADGMIHAIQRKIEIKKTSTPDIDTSVQATNCSYENIGDLNERFDYIFSNFGGLNCIDDLKKVTTHFKSLLHPGGYVTMVIMPRVCLWEMATALKGNPNAFRRWRRDGVEAHIDGQYFPTWYFGLDDISEAMGTQFTLVKSEGLAALSPPPHRSDFPGKHPNMYRFLRNIDRQVRGHFPFNRWADHIIVTFKFSG